MVIRGAPHIAMVGQRNGILRFLGEEEVVFQQLAYKTIRVLLMGNGQGTGFFKTLGIITALEAQQAVAGLVPLLRVRRTGKDQGNELAERL